MKLFELIKEQEATGKLICLTTVDTPARPFTELVVLSTGDVKKVVVMPPKVPCSV
jgi:hypothetical protein